MNVVLVVVKVISGNVVSVSRVRCCRWCVIGWFLWLLLLICWWLVCGRCCVFCLGSLVLCVFLL